LAITKVKLCGLRRKEDAAIVNALQPSYTGFVFYPKSHRYLSVQQALDLRHMLDPAIPAVGVFYEAPLEDVIRTARSGAVDMIQLHGSEDEIYMRELRESLKKQSGNAPDGGNLPIIKTFMVRDEIDLSRAASSSAEYVMLDAAAGGGEVFDWAVAAKSPALALIRPRMFFAGGLSAENVGEAIRTFAPFAVDVSSSLETDGYKDAEKCRAFMEAVRNA